MFISVTERKREIGIKKAIGATNVQIGTEFIIEGITISVIGCIIGILLISKLINFLLKKFESITYCGIFGLIAASPFAILVKMENPKYTVVSVIVGIVLFVAGAAFTYFFEKFATKKEA